MTGWVVAAALAALLAALELRRPNRRNLAVRIVAVMVAVAALFLLLDPPRLPANPGPGGVAVLLTPGADALARRHLADSLPGVPQVASPDSAPDLDALRRRYPDLRTVVVAGFGLRASMLARHGDLEIVRYPATSPDGLIHLAWTKEVTIGDPVTVTARLEPAPRPRLVRFEGPAGGRDSVRVAADSTGPVSFRTTPAAV